ncbi:hypothetical protein [Virgibacillus proomii]|jgi:hypothetical protein|nr:hypothetical protein [Virgibacillus proomii]
MERKKKSDKEDNYNHFMLFDILTDALDMLLFIGRMLGKMITSVFRSWN